MKMRKIFAHRKIFVRRETFVHKETLFAHKKIFAHIAALCLSLSLAAVLAVYGVVSLYGQEYDEAVQECNEAVQGYNETAQDQDYNETAQGYYETIQGLDEAYHLHDAQDMIDAKHNMHLQNMVDTDNYIQNIIDQNIIDIYRNTYIITDEDIINLSGIYLQGYDIIINATQPDFDIIVANASGDGNIIIASGYGGRVILNNVNISGEVIVKSGGFVDLMLSNSNASSVVFYSVGRINILTMPISGASTPMNNISSSIDVTINVTGVHLLGNFNRVYSNLHDGVIYFDGNISGLYAIGNVFLIGAGNIGYIDAPIGIIVGVFDPDAEADDPVQGLAQELAAILEGLFVYHLERLETNIFNRLDQMFANLGLGLNFGLPNFNFTQQMPQLPQATPTPTPTPSPGPYIPVLRPPDDPSGSNSNSGSGSGSNSGSGSSGVFVPRDGYTGINAININIMPPNILPQALLPSHLLSNVQRTVTDNGDNFIGVINWFYNDENDNRFGDRFTGHTFEPGVRYRAQIILTPNSRREFVAPDISSQITIMTHDNRGYTRINRDEDVFRPDRIVITLAFGPAGPAQAGSFSLSGIKGPYSEIEGPFNQVRVNTHYLGQLSAANFIMHFGGNPITDFTVSTFNHSGNIMQGYYILTLANTQHPTADRELSVRMTGLPYHIPHIQSAHITPKPAPQTGPSLNATIALPGEFVSVRNFPQDIAYTIYLSTIPLSGPIDAFMAFISGQARIIELHNSSNPLQQQIFIPIDTPFGQNYVYIVDASSAYLVGMLEVVVGLGVNLINPTPDVGFVDLIYDISPIDPILLGVEYVGDVLVLESYVIGGYLE